MIQGDSLDAQRRRAGEGGRVGHVADHGRDLEGRVGAAGRLHQSDHVVARAGRQDGDADGRQAHCDGAAAGAGARKSPAGPGKTTGLS